MNKQINNKDGQLKALLIAKQQNKIALNYNLKLKKYPHIDIDINKWMNKTKSGEETKSFLKKNSTPYIWTLHLQEHNFILCYT